MSRIIGIYAIQDNNDYKYHGFTHDHSICVIEDGKITDYLQLERHSRRKYDNRMPAYLEELIDNQLINIESEDIIVSVNSFIGQSVVTKNGRFRIEPLSSMALVLEPQKAFCSYTRNWDETQLEAYVISHELAHIGSNLPFYGEFKDNSLLIQ